MNSEDFNVLPPQPSQPENPGEEPFSFDDLWDDRPKTVAPEPVAEPRGDEIVPAPETSAIRSEIEDLEREKQILQAEIAALKAEKEQLIAAEVGDIKAYIERMVSEGVKELEGRKQTLEVSIEQLERRRERIRQEMKTSFAGVSQDLAVRIQGFKEYLVGSLQDLAAAAENLELPRFEDRPSRPTAETRPNRLENERSDRTPLPPRAYRSEDNDRPNRGNNEFRSYRPSEDSGRANRSGYESESPRANRSGYESEPPRANRSGYDAELPRANRSGYESEPPRSGRAGTSLPNRSGYESDSSRAAPGDRGFQEQKSRIQALLDRYRTRPDYYGPPWQLRRTFEPIHAERVQQWFFKQGGRGAIRGMGSRLQNILVASAVMSILADLQGDRFRSLVLANSPERLGEWRRGLQDCLGISRADFGPDRGVVLFESPEALIQKADRLIEDGFSPLIIIDDTEERLNFALLQFPYWLAFTPDPQQSSSYWY